MSEIDTGYETIFDLLSKENPSVERDASAFYSLLEKKVPATMLTPRGAHDKSGDGGGIPQTVLELGIYLRERDFLYFGLEIWTSSLVKKQRINARVKCVSFEGEIPCLYTIWAPDKDGPTHTYAKIPKDVFSLVDSVSAATGAGLGIAVGISQKSKGGSDSGVRIDPRTGRRMRYKITPYPDPRGDKDVQLCWIERSEIGRGRGRTSGGSPPIPAIF